MSGDRLANDPTIRGLREEIDEIDVDRALLMASWIVSTVVKLDRIENNELTHDEAYKHWQPYAALSLLTSRRDRRTDEVGRRKKEVELMVGEPITVNQEGRWQSVKHSYQHAVFEEAGRANLSKTESYTALEWMHYYTEYEHLRSKRRQTSLQKKSEGGQAVALVPNEGIAAVNTPTAEKLPPRFPRLFHHRRSSGHKQSA